MDMVNIVEIIIETIIAQKEYYYPRSKKTIRDAIKSDSEREMKQYFLRMALK